MSISLNFLLTNRIPRRFTTLFMGWFTQLELPIIRDASLALWKACAELNLHEAKKARFTSVRDCFTRELKPGARPIDSGADVLVSPCDAIVGACGRIRGTQLFQAKGFGYTLDDLLCDEALIARYRDGHYVTLRLTSSMYHRFHAPTDGRVDEVIYISGDTWNVNPIALRRVERLFCKNERAIVDFRSHDADESIALVAVAAILVASMRFTFLDVTLSLKYRGPNRIPCEATFRKGDELGHFLIGSTIIVFSSDRFVLCDGVAEGTRIRMGEALLRRACAAALPTMSL